MSITPGQYDITIYQGATYNRQFTWKDQNNSPINLTGFSARMMARTSIDAPSSFISLTTANGGITLGGTLGTITLMMTDSQTSALSAVSGFYDLELVDSAAKVTRLLQGSLTVSPEVTR